MTIAKRSRFYKAVQQEANRLLSKYKAARLIPKANGACVDCGATRFVCHDHRDYSEALTVEVVCYSCNQRRGTAVIPFLDIGSMQWILYREIA